MKYFSMFAGIGGFDLAFNRLGHECIGYSEIDKYAIQVYRKRFGLEVKNYGDATKINGDDLPDFDILCGGFPCQTFSLAGNRKGFEDSRGTLFYEIARIAETKRPRYLFLENVKGLLNHDSGKTFGTIVRIIWELGYDVDFGLVNSRYFGVPQNRERVFIIGSLRGQPRPEVFPLRREMSETDEQVVSTAIDANYGKGIDNHGARTGIMMLDVYNNRLRNESPTLTDPCHNSIRVMVYDDYNQNLKKEQIACTLTQNTGSEAERNGQKLISLNTMQRGMRQPFVIAHINRKTQEYTLKDTDISGSLTSSIWKGIDGLGRTGIKVYSLQERSADRPSLKNNPNAGGSGTLTRDDGQTYCLDSGCTIGIGEGPRIRRLTPLECERLQAFPDSWTEYGIDDDGNEVRISDSQRYKMCGNAVTVNVVYEIAKRLPK